MIAALEVKIYNVKYIFSLFNFKHSNVEYEELIAQNNQVSSVSI